MSWGAGEIASVVQTPASPACRDDAVPTIERRVLGLDPSATRTGFALMRDASTIIDMGCVVPDRQADTPLRRLESQILALEALIQAARPTVAVIEVTSGHVAKRHGGGGAGLAIYGGAVGGIYIATWLWMGRNGGRVEGVLENVWTRGVPKRQRRGHMAMTYPAYRRIAERDKGGDIADALGLCHWWFYQRGGR
ncbi:MAG TPA: hypothetical protein P5255_14015 [Phycisphaerae bacterium]|nr:hypothetical protein [Phycisphaerae bacterium]HRT43334.1 hypothetical protein [Phycisphaerae bacterium]